MLLIENVTVRFGGVTALDDFSAQVSDGEICGFIGPNGAGKTTSASEPAGFYTMSTASCSNPAILGAASCTGGL